jgi:hypothetical protein
MKRIVRIVFEYDDKTKEEIIDPRAALLFQSRCNACGVLAGMEHQLNPVVAKVSKRAPKPTV